MTPQEIVDARESVNEKAIEAVRAERDEVARLRAELHQVCQHSTGHVFAKTAHMLFDSGRVCLYCHAPEPAKA